MMRDSKRKCAKCNASTAQHSELALHRFPKPGPSNAKRLIAWAKFCYPEENWNSVEFQTGLYVSHKMLCSNHFPESAFVQDHLQRKKLHRYSIPSELSTTTHSSQVEMSIAETETSQQPGTSRAPDSIDSSDYLHLEQPGTSKATSSSIDIVQTTNSSGAMLEVCIDSLESATNAVHGGANELEVCSSLTEGGLTPSPGLVKQIVEMVNNIAAGKPIRKSCHDCGCDKLTKRPKVNVMIRCRTGSDFHYSAEEMDTMLSDVDVFKAFGVDRFVFGALTETQHIDVINCERLISQAEPIPVTFHRAFDVCMDPLLSVTKIAKLGFNRLLTSGQKPTANNVEAIQLINSLISSAGDKVEIMPGAGINLGNAKTFIDIGCKIVHSSCKRIRYLPQIKNSLNMGTSDSEHVFVTDENIVKKMKEIINEN